MFTLSIVLFFIGLFYFINKRRLKENHEFILELKNKEIELMNAVVQAQEQERTKMARDLHDEVGSILSIAQHNLSAVLKQIPEDSSLLEDLEFTRDILDQSVTEIRAISNNMLPHYLIKFGLPKSIKRLIDQVEKTLGNSCTFSCSIDENFVFDKQSEINFYAISLELFNNVLKHARPKSVHVSMEIIDFYLFFKINHDGIAISQFDYEYLIENGNGIGLESIAQRLKLILGEIQYQRLSIGGTIQLSMPTHKTEKF